MGDYINKENLGKEETGDLIVSLLSRINYLEVELYKLRENFKQIKTQRSRGLSSEIEEDEKAGQIVSTLKQINDLQVELYKARSQFEKLCAQKGITLDKDKDEMER